MRKMFLITLYALLITNYCVYADSGGFEYAEKLFLEGRYERAASEAARLIDEKSPRRDELYYLKGLCELKLKRCTNARESFEELLYKYPESKLAFDARIGIGDSYFLEGDNGSAHKAYSDAVESSPNSKNIAAAYYKLGVCYKNMGSDDRARQCFEKVKYSSPGSFEARMIPKTTEPTHMPEEKKATIPSEARTNFVPAKSNISPRISPAKEVPVELIVTSSENIIKKQFSVQVGSFNSRRNADKLVQRLSRQGFEARVEMPAGDKDRLYRVKIGKFASRTEAEATAARLKKMKYGTKICEQ